jgi:hypothetical protein
VFKYHVISCGFPGDIVDKTGDQHANIRVGGGDGGDEARAAFPMLRMATIDLDRTFVHWDYNAEKMKALLVDHPEVMIEIIGPPFWLLKATDNTTSVRALLKEYKIETNREYIHRSRQGLNQLRQLH